MFPGNYRPISLFSALSKVAEAVIRSRFRDELLENQVLQDEQFGFSAGLSADYQLFRLTEAAREALERRETAGAVFFDLANAFDSVWHDGVVHKMCQAGCNNQLARIVKSYLRGRSFSVRVGDHLSTIRPMVTGVPQGSLLGPELFPIYISDLPGTPMTQLAIYADDTAVFMTSRDERLVCRRLQSAVDGFLKWTEKWRLKLNTGKCVAVRFTRRRKLPVDYINHGEDAEFGQPGGELYSRPRP